jgi:hypothetical protein
LGGLLEKSLFLCTSVAPAFAPVLGFCVASVLADGRPGFVLFLVEIPPFLFCVRSAVLLCLSSSAGIVVPLLSAGAVTRPLGMLAACLIGEDVAEEGLMVGLFGRSFVFGFWVELSVLGVVWRERLVGGEDGTVVFGFVCWFGVFCGVSVVLDRGWYWEWMSSDRPLASCC